MLTGRNAQVVALKELKLAEAVDGLPMTVIREIKALKKVQNVDQAFGLVNLREIACTPSKPRCRLMLLKHTLITVDGERIHLVFDYFEHDLNRILPKELNNELPIENVRHYMRQLLGAINVLHGVIRVLLFLFLL